MVLCKALFKAGNGTEQQVCGGWGCLEFHTFCHYSLKGRSLAQWVWQQLLHQVLILLQAAADPVCWDLLRPWLACLFFGTWCEMPGDGAGRLGRWWGRGIQRWSGTTSLPLLLGCCLSPGTTLPPGVPWVNALWASLLQGTIKRRLFISRMKAKSHFRLFTRYPRFPRLQNEEKTPRQILHECWQVLGKLSLGSVCLSVFNSRLTWVSVTQSVYTTSFNFSGVYSWDSDSSPWVIVV